MEAWEKWWRMAQGSLAAAQALGPLGEFRSAASRAYYAAYQAATALLLYTKRVPPEGREAWGHEATPDLLNDTPSAVLSLTTRRSLTKRLEELYQVRLVADYRGEEDVTAAALRDTVRSAAFIIKTIGTVFPGA